jgi:hypothetical protein
MGVNSMVDGEGMKHTLGSISSFVYPDKAIGKFEHVVPA